jgi:hypothetical protein
MALRVYNRNDNGGFRIFDRGGNGGFLAVTTPDISIITANLILEYDSINYSGTGTTITDSSGNGRNGTISGNPSYDGDYFTFVNDYLYTPDLDSILTGSNPPHSVEVWAYPTNNGVLVSYTSDTDPTLNYHFSAIELVNNRPEFGLWTGTLTSTNTQASTIQLNQWHQFVLTYDGSNLRGYINGSLVASLTSINFETPFEEGGRPGFIMHFGPSDVTNQGDGTFFDGKFGIMRIYDKELTDVEVLQNYNATVSNFTNVETDNLILWLDANEINSYGGSGTTWFDLTSPQYNATLVNSPTFSSGSFTFNGTNQYASIPHTSSLKPTNEITLEQWLNADDWTAGTPTSYKTALSTAQGGGYAHYIWEGVWKSYVRTAGSYQIPTADVSSLTGWHHFVTTFDGRYTKLYIDGVIQNTLDLGSSGNPIQYAFNNSLLIGAEASSTTTPETPDGKYWDGKISTTLLYDRALTDNEVLQNYNTTKTRFGI